MVRTAMVSRAIVSRAKVSRAMVSRAMVAMVSGAAMVSDLQHGGPSVMGAIGGMPRARTCLEPSSLPAAQIEGGVSSGQRRSSREAPGEGWG